MSTVKKVMVALLMMCLAAACTGTGGTGGGAALTGSGAGTVVVALPSDDPGDIQLRQAEAKEFMKQNPDISVKVLTIPGQNYDEKVVTMIAGGKPPDVFGSGDVQIPNIVRKHYAVDLAPIIKAEKYDTADFYPQVIQGLTFDGKLVGLTDNWDTQVLYYNKSLFDSKHVPYPTDQWTWEDFREAARKLTSGSGAKKTYGAVFDPWFAPMYDQIWSYGGDVFSKDGTKCMLSSPQSTAAIQWIADLFKEGVSPGPSQLSQQGQDASQIFLSGRAAMSIGSGRWSAFDLKDVQKFKWAIAPVPKGPAGRANFFHLAMFAMAANSKNKAGAWKFLKFMVSEAGIRMAAKNMQGIPSRQSLAKDPSITQSPLVVEHDAYQPFVTSLPTVHSAPYVPNFGQLQDKIDAALDPVWAGKKQASEVTGPLCADLDKSLARAGGP
jgi:multiple sugar transport system substrate-binding protein